MSPCKDCNNRLVITAIKWIPGISLVFIGWLSWVSLAAISNANANTRHDTEIKTLSKQTLIIVATLNDQKEAFTQMSQAFAVHDSVQKAMYGQKDTSMHSREKITE